ncbi:MAG TPA: FtsX-like permease family protein [Streptosporangiaceae bacterium]|nr:FtsX-like permease family protein [Streptosporangiaceae bacterium]
MRRPPASVRHITAHPLAFSVVALTVLFTTMCAAAAASFASGVTAIAVRRSLAADAGTAISVSVIGGAAGPATVTDRVGRRLTTAAAGLPLSIATARQSSYYRLPGRGEPGGRAETQVISLTQLPRHAVLLTGRWPAGMTGPGGPATTADSRGPVPACLPGPAARRLHLAAGDLVTLRDVTDNSAITARVSCTFARRQPGGGYWSLSPLPATGTQRSAGSVLYGPLVTSRAELTARHIPVQAARLRAVPDVSALQASRLPALATRLRAAVSQLAGSNALGGATVTTRLPALLSGLATAVVVSRSQLLIGLLILLVIAGATITVAVRLLVAAREGEMALLAARGAARRQLAARGLADALALAIPAAVAGPFLAGWLLALLTRTGPLARSRLSLPPGQPAAAWLTAVVVAAGCAVIISLPWLRRPPSAVLRRVQAGRQRAIGAAVTAGADLALLVLAAAATWQLAHFSAPVTTGLDGRLGADPILVAAPVLAIGAGSLVTLRLLPLAARLADRAASRSRGLTGAVAAWQLSRRPLRHPGPALLAMFAVATAVVALAMNGSWRSSATAQAAFRVGADTAVSLPASSPLPVGQVAAVTRARGVRASTPTVQAQASTPQGVIADVLAISGPAASGALALDTAQTGLSPGRLTAALARLRPAGPPPGTPVPGRPARLLVTARLRVARSALPRHRSGPAIAAPALSVQLTDAAGVAYQVTAGTLPADGRRHQLTAEIAPGLRADYPLRLTGFFLEYLQRGLQPAPASLAIGAVRTAGPAGGPAGVVTAAAAGHPLLVVGDQSAAAPGQAAARLSGTGLTVSFRTGRAQPGVGGGPAYTSLEVTPGPRPAPLPALATRAFLAASGTSPGQIVQVQVQGVSIPVRLAAEVTRFPTITGPAGGLVIDQAALQDALRTRGVPPVPVTEWLLRTGPGLRLTGLPAGTSVTSSAAVARALVQRPLSVAPLVALLAIAAAAIILACAGFVVSAATSQDRRRDMAMLDALGTWPRQVMRMLCLEQAMTAVPAAAAGLAIGGLLSQLIVPAMSLTAQAARPNPPVLVQVPWLLAGGIALVIAAIPVLTAGLPALRSLAVAAMLRTQEET